MVGLIGEEFILKSGLFQVGEGDTVNDVCIPISDKTFTGEWRFTPFFMEAGNSLLANRTNEGNETLFSTEDCYPWGIYKSVNFDAENLVLKDGALEVALSPFDSPMYDSSCSGIGKIRMCELQEDSNVFEHLNFPLIIPAGANLIFFNDTGGDCDYDDIGLVAIPPPVGD